ncbi:MAG: trypsin-like peptidase domain-containing protein [Pyrinomonadaceae bacterium]
MFKRRIIILLANVTVIFSCCAFALAQISGGNLATDAAVDSVVTILLADNGQANPVGSGLVVRSDGYILTAYHLIKGAREIQIRFRNGEIYDKAEIVSIDERRNVALLHINALGLRSIPGGTIEESQVGARIIVVANPAGQTLISSDKTLNSVQLADSISGASRGFRVLQFDQTENAAGGLLLDENGHSLGIVTTNPEIRNQSIAVPLSSVLGLIRSASYNNSSVNSSVYFPSSPSPQNTPYPISQSAVQMPERGVTPLSPRGPGSVVIKPVTPKEILAASKTIYVTSETVFFKPEQLINALNKRQEIGDWGLSFVADRDVADLILEIDHLVFTYKFTFKIYSQRLGSIIATGDVIIFDGNLGADDMAKRVIEKLALVRAASEKKTDTDKDKKPDKKDSN